VNLNHGDGEIVMAFDDQGVVTVRDRYLDIGHFFFGRWQLGAYCDGSEVAGVKYTSDVDSTSFNVQTFKVCPDFKRLSGADDHL